MKIIIEVELDNFTIGNIVDPFELSACLRGIVNDIGDGVFLSTIIDSNGNTVGRCRIE